MSETQPVTVSSAQVRMRAALAEFQQARREHAFARERLEVAEIELVDAVEEVARASAPEKFAGATP